MKKWKEKKWRKKIICKNYLTALVVKCSIQNSSFWFILFSYRPYHIRNSLLLLNSQLHDCRRVMGINERFIKHESSLLTAVQDQQTAQQHHNPESWGHRQPRIPPSSPLPKGRSHQSQPQFSSQISLQSGSYSQQLFTRRLSSLVSKLP